MSSPNPVDVVLQFEQLINSRNVDAIAGLLTEDSVFIDSLGQCIQGISKLRGAWTGYFKMVMIFDEPSGQRNGIALRESIIGAQ